MTSSPSGRCDGFKRECDQQRAQPGSRHIDGDAVIRANLERSKHPDLHRAGLNIGYRHSSRFLTRRRKPSALRRAAARFIGVSWVGS